MTIEFSKSNKDCEPLKCRIKGVLCSKGGLLGLSHTLANLDNDHVFISKGIHLHWDEAF